MKIAVCINHLPDTASRIIPDAEKISIDDTEITYVINPYDEHAVEEALRLREKHGGEVVILSVGDDSHRESIRKALAMGGDRAVLIKGDRSLDSHNIASALAAEIKEVGADVVLLGKQSVDYDNCVVGPMIAEMLRINSVTLVAKLEIDGDDVTAKREIEGAQEVISTFLPAVITVEKGINVPRYPNLKGIMHAKDKPLEEREFRYRENLVNVTELMLPPEKKAGEIIGTGKEAVPILMEILKRKIKFS